MKHKHLRNNIAHFVGCVANRLLTLHGKNNMKHKHLHNNIAHSVGSVLRTSY